MIVSHFAPSVQQKAQALRGIVLRVFPHMEGQTALGRADLLSPQPHSLKRTA